MKGATTRVSPAGNSDDEAKSVAPGRHSSSAGAGAGAAAAGAGDAAPSGPPARMATKQNRKVVSRPRRRKTTFDRTKANSRVGPAPTGAGAGGAGAAAAVGESDAAGVRGVRAQALLAAIPARTLRRASMIPLGAIRRQPTRSSQDIMQHGKVINLLAHSADLHSSIHHGVVASATDHHHPAAGGDGNDDGNSDGNGDPGDADVDGSSPSAAAAAGGGHKEWKRSTSAGATQAGGRGPAAGGSTAAPKTTKNHIVKDAQPLPLTTTQLAQHGGGGGSSGVGGQKPASGKKISNMQAFRRKSRAKGERRASMMLSAFTAAATASSSNNNKNGDGGGHNNNNNNTGWSSSSSSLPLSEHGSAKTLQANISEQDMLEALEHDIDMAIELASVSRASSNRRLPACCSCWDVARAKVRALVEAPATQHTVTALVVLNAVLIGVETDFGPSGYYCEGGEQGHGCDAGSVQAVFVIDNVIVALFNLEVALKLFAHGGDFFKGAWNVFDLAVILLSDMDLVLGAVPSVDLQAGLSALRLLRVVRIFRLLKSVPELQQLTEAFLSSAPGVMWVGVLMVLMFMVYGVIATVSFGLNTGQVAQQADYTEWFGTVGSSMYSLFQIMTLESWSMGIVRKVMEEWPYAWAFFVSWILLSSYGMLNLLASIFVEKILEAKEKTDKAKKAEQSVERKEVKALLHDYFFQMSSAQEDGLTLQELKEGVRKEPLFRSILSDTGWMKDGTEVVDTLFEILDINGDGLVNYDEFLNIALSTNESLTKEDVLQQRLHVRARMDELFEDLHFLDRNLAGLCGDTVDESTMPDDGAVAGEGGGGDATAAAGTSGPDATTAAAPADGGSGDGDAGDGSAAGQAVDGDGAGGSDAGGGGGGSRAGADGVAAVLECQSIGTRSQSLSTMRNLAVVPEHRAAHHGIKQPDGGDAADAEAKRGEADPAAAPDSTATANTATAAATAAHSGEGEKDDDGVDEDGGGSVEEGGGGRGEEESDGGEEAETEEGEEGSVSTPTSTGSGASGGGGGGYQVSSVLRATTAAVFGDCAREELFGVCRRAMAVPLQVAQDPEAWTKEELLQRLETKARRSLLWWSH